MNYSHALAEFSQSGQMFGVRSFAGEAVRVLGAQEQLEELRSALTQPSRLLCCCRMRCRSWR